ncbi:hypothetical protein D7B24_009413 [Verticillium nonalfalfae]|uniref:Transcription factor domain-containing protein n=1 Tax=Verticillium nonalfalfae TaxID=1051616 RepID=A0A3M9Y2X6_9PEZI|nr:uncharacterized protein D7B24_009413 [Verticillium nonalfalfae]RNJ54797.1 hypothetical protein D7B24_009413 [Verticillium nonalfalfae]
MKLASNFDHDDGVVRNPAVYQLAKACCTSMERDRFISLRLVQCLTLIAVYELGHAIFPEAYVTIGHASRLGGMIGLHNKTLAQQLFVTADTWTCGEEQRRTWYVNIGTRYLPPSVLEPCLDALLPVNDRDWNEGRISASESLLTTSFHSTANLGSFARTCQAAHILNKVLKHRDHRTHSGQDTETVLHEALALHGALVALEESLAPHCVFFGDSHNDESAGTVDSPSTHPGPEVVVTATSPGMENALALSLSASARMMLYKIYGPNEPKAGYGGGRTALETQMQRLSLAGTRDLVLRLGSGLAGGVTCGGATSPMLSSLSYHVAKECAWLIKEDYDTTMYQALRKLVDSLRQLATEWQVAQEYLALLEKGEILGLIPDE